MHSIRLTGHWTRSETASGHYQFTRRFGRPRLPAGNESVWLSGVAPGDGQLCINGRSVTGLLAGTRFEADVTVLLRARNEVQLELTSDVEPAEITLEIRD